MRLRYSSTSFLVPKIGWNNVRTYSFQYKVCPSYWRKQPRTFCIHCYPICSKLSPTSRIQVACKLLSSVGAVATVFLFLVPLSLALHRETSLVLEAWKYVDKYYVDQSIHPAWLQLRQKIIHHPGSENAHALIRDMLSTLHDPYTRLLEPEEYQSFKATATGQLTGIGIQLAPNIEHNKVFITHVYPQSPAAMADIREGDAIIAVDQFPVSQAMNADQVALHIRGEKDTMVHLTLERNSKWLEKNIRRQDYVTKTVESNILNAESSKVGYLRIRNFDFHTVEEVEQVLTDWKRQHIHCCVMDLRDNAGGYFPAGVGVAGLFLPDNSVIVYTVDHRGIEETYQSNHSGIFADGCVVILVNERTASASELLTAALHEQRGSLIVGNKTFGKGVVQRLFPLSDGSAITVTMMKYLTPNHEDIHRKGIDVDVHASCVVDNSLKCTPNVPNPIWCLPSCCVDRK